MTKAGDAGAPDTLEELIARAGRDESYALGAGEARAADGLPPDRVGMEAETEAPGAAASPSISATAVAMIIAFEVTSRAVYERRYRAPIWPRGASGVTIGIGYDIGYMDAAGLRADWGPHLPSGTLDRLIAACGVTGAAAGALIPGLADLSIPWEAAEAVFRDRTLPRYTATTLGALPNAVLLSPDSLGALVSLVYNRGASFRRTEDRFREMRAIRAHVERRAFAAIPAEIRAMRRLWEGNPDMAGLLRRREAEAALFERGLEDAAPGEAPEQDAPAATESALEGAGDLLAWAKGWIGRVVATPTRDMVFARIASPPGGPEGDVVVRTGTAYVSLRVLSARIVNARRWTSRYHAAVHARSDMLYEGGSGRIERQVVLSPDGFRDLDPGGQGKLLQIDRPLFGPAPYLGDLRLSLGLFSVKSSDLAGPYLTLLGQLAETSALGFLKAAQPYVAPLRNAAELLFGTSDAANLECGVVRGFRELRTGIWVSLGAPRAEVPQPEAMRLDPEDFHLLWPDGRAVTEHPYVVFSVEAAAQRDDWMAIPDLREAWEAVRTAVNEHGEGEEVRAALESFKRRCRTSPDLLAEDARGLIRRAEARFGLGEAEAPVSTPRPAGSFADLDLYGRRI